MKNDNLSKAISDRNRIRIIVLLCKGPLKVTDIANKLELEENLTSHHLRVLHSLRFLKSQKKGREVFYQVSRTRFASVFKDILKIPLFKELIKDILKNKN
jgi:DNA-binding transcriptional ArsR family regulator